MLACQEGTEYPSFLWCTPSGLESLIHSQSEVRQQSCICPIDSTWIKNYLLKLESGICQYAVFQYFKIASSWLVVPSRMYKFTMTQSRLLPPDLAHGTENFAGVYTDRNIFLYLSITQIAPEQALTAASILSISIESHVVRLADRSWSPTMFKDFDQGPQALMESLCASWSFLVLLWYCKSDTSKPHAHRPHQTTDLAHASRPVKQPQITAILISILTDAGRIIFGM